MSNDKSKVMVYTLPFASAIAIAFYFVFGEHLSDKMNPITISSLVMLFSGILLLLFYALRYSGQAIKTEFLQNKINLSIIGGFLFAGYFFSFLALSRTTATSVTIFTAVEPLICTVFAYFGFIVARERLSKRTLLIMAVLFGSVLVSKLSMGAGTLPEIKIGWGELLALLSATAFAFAILISKKMCQSDSQKAIIVIGSALTIGGFLLNLFLAATGKLVLPVEPGNYFYLLGIVIFVALSWLFFYVSLASSLGAALTEVLYQSKILFVFLLTLIASRLGWLKLKAIISPVVSFIGIILVIAFSILLVISHQRDME
ncbi:MAG: DMT family transporter [Acidobacteria bacterium]|nr:DMT family transporter [Acidobacteriota bacterium]